MEDYIKELRQAQHHFRHKFYSTSIYECGRIIECGMKDLYVDLEAYLEKEGLSQEFESMRQQFANRRRDKEEFNYEKATLGSMILFARYSGFWDKLKSMCESNLSFLKMVNWSRVRKLRNDSAHNQDIFGRNEALEMLFYTKVFLYDCGLIEGMNHAAPEILDAHCAKCDFKISHQWNFCPNCSAEISKQCHNCDRALMAGHRICPHCDAPQPGTTNRDESVKTYKKYAEAVWADWEVTPLERSWLDNKRLELGINPEEAEKIETTVIPKNYHHFQNLIQAVNIDGVIDSDEEQFLMNKADHLEITQDIATKMISSSKKAGKKIRKSLWRLA
ncbi:MAG: zinc ribbon domain-containing protein [Flavobacteriales bacterium]|nr:zinc ribbon domain-containing protein [Flavobacteriales bacterium]